MRTLMAFLTLGLCFTTGLGVIAPASGSAQNANSAVLDAKRLALWTQRCEQQKDGFACFVLVRHFEAVASTPANKTSIRRYTRMACEIPPETGEKADFMRKVTGKSCRRIGSDLMSGTNGAKDLKASTAYFARGCGFDEVNSCAFLAEAYKDGRGVERDEAKALATYRKACSDKMPVACFQPARMLFFDAMKQKRGQSDVAAADLAFARKAASIACRSDWGGQGISCFYDASYQDGGWGGPKNRAAALPSYKKACEMKPDRLDICFLYASALIRYPAPLQDKPAGYAIMKDICSKGHKSACQTVKRQ